MHTSKTVVFLAFAASISAYNWDTELDARDIDDYLTAQELVVRAAKGGRAGSWGRGAERGVNAAGNVGTALTGVADFGNMIRGNGNGKRDLEAAELFVRTARGGGGRGGGARSGSAAQWGRRVERGSDAAGNVGTALNGVADIGKMIKGQGKRDLEFEELMARAAAARGGRAGSWGRGAERGANAAGNVGTALTGVADFGNMIRGNGKRDLEDLLFDDSELFAREEFEFEDFEY